MSDTSTGASPLAAALRTGRERTGIPGAVALTAAPGGPVQVAACGWAVTHDERGPLATPVAVTDDTVFDVASLTKLVATTGVAMALVDQGRLALDTPATRHLPAFRGGGKEHVTVGHLLAHRGGLEAWYPLFLHTDDRAEAVALACRRPLAAPPGATRLYSDLGFVVLGAVIEAVSGDRLDATADRLVFGPLGMDDTGFRPPPGRRAGRRVAATSTGNPAERRLVAGLREKVTDLGRDTGSWWRAHTLIGEVNDANAAQALQGVAGHAGVFSTAADLGRFAQAVLAGGTLDGRRVWSPEVVARFLRPDPEPTQALGFWLRRASAVRATGVVDDDSFGHRGFSGCELAASPRSGWVAVLLTNRLHTGEDPPTDHRPLWQGVVEEALRRVERSPGS